MNLLSSRFLNGPNIHGPVSGIIAGISLMPDEMTLAGWRPGASAVARCLTLARQVFSMTADQTFLRSPDEIRNAAEPLLELMFTLFEFSVRDFCARPGFGRLAGQGDGQWQVFLPCDEEQLAGPALSFALNAAPAIAALGPAPAPQMAAALAGQYRQLRSFLQVEGFSSVSMALARAAADRGIPHRRIFERAQFMRLGHGAASRRIVETASDNDSPVGGMIASDKFAVVAVLGRNALPTADTRQPASPDHALEFARTLVYPLVLKPRSGAEGRRPILNIADEAALRVALREAQTYQTGVLLERHIAGADHALLVIGGRLACALRMNPLTDVTGEVHPDNRRMAERAARVVGLDLAEVTFLAPDVARSWREQPAAILNVRMAPNLAPYLAAAPARDLAGAVVGELFPDGADGRIPTAAVTGSIGKSTTCHMTAAILAAAGKRVARTSTQGAWIGADKIATGDVAGGPMANGLLLDTGVEAGVFEMARGGLIKFGMWLDGVDVGAVLNVQDNHLGHEGVETREDLAAVKSLVVRNARKLAILNADDPLCLRMRESITAPRLCLVSTAADNPAVRAHQRQGGLAGRLHRVEGEDAQTEIRLYEGEVLIGAMTAAEIPSSLDGRYEPPLIGALYAASIAHGLGVGFETIRAGLAGFESNLETNPFRMNFMEGLPYTLCLTWADGPAAFGALCDFAARTPAAGAKTLMFSMMGDRGDDFLDQSATVIGAAGAFERYIVSDAVDLRGRPAMQAARRLADGLMGQGVAEDRISIAAGHEAASAAALSCVKAGDLLVIVTPRVGGERILKELAAMRQSRSSRPLPG